MPTSFLQRGGARVGFSRWLAVALTWPFAWLSVAEGRCEFSVFPFFFLRPCVFTPSTVRRLSIYTGLRPASMVRPPRFLRVEHAVRGYPPFLLFYSFDLPQLIRELARHGFLVEGT